jgi:hypothetical protein
MNLDNRSHTFILKMAIVNFLFVASVWTGKSIFYLFADFALFAFIATLIYIHVVSFIEKKKLMQPEEPVQYITRG